MKISISLFGELAMAGKQKIAERKTLRPTVDFDA